LMWKFIGSANIGVVSQEQPSHELKYLPPELVNAEHSQTLADFEAAETVFMLDTDTHNQPNVANQHLLDSAMHVSEHAKVVLTGTHPAEIAENVSFLHALRPDVEIFGHAHPEGVRCSSHDARREGPIEAFRSVSANLKGETVPVVRPLSESDAEWVATLTKQAVKAGTAVNAYFNESGMLDRQLFSDAFALDQTGTLARVSSEVNAHGRAIAKLQTQAATNAQVTIAAGLQSRRNEAPQPMPGIAVKPGEVRERFASIGSAIVVGGTGNIGTAMTEAMGGKIPVDTVNRTLSKKRFDHSGTADFPVNEHTNFSTIADKTGTVFVTASVPWKTDPKTGEIIFDRNALIEDNIKALLPIFKNLPQESRKIVIVSNPCSELTAIAALLRPDLASKLLAHAGTDAVRNKLRNTDRSPANSNPSISLEEDPNDADVVTVRPADPMIHGGNTPASALEMARAGQQPAQAVVGPHAPEMVAAVPGLKRIDSKVNILGKILSDEAGGRSVTDPTALSAIEEASNSLLELPGSYAQVLTRKESKALTALMKRWHTPVAVPEGIAPTLPRDSRGRVDWKMLKASKDSILEGKDGEANQTYPEKVSAALQTMADNFELSVGCLAKVVREKNPELGEIDNQWVLDNRADLLTKYL
jgi:hypothetical protein